MTETSKVYKGVLITDSLENYIDKEHVSLCQFLFFLNIADIAQYVKNNFYTDKTWHFKYDVEAMIKLVVVKFFRQKSFKKTISTLTEEEAWLLGFQEKDNEIPIPTGSALHHFVKYRLGVEGIDEIMLMLGKKIAKLSNSNEAKLDSTPLEASRYSKNSKFNPHYECKMDKAHITMIGTYPVYMTYTDGLAGDSPELPSHIAALLRMNAKIDEYRLDGAYDSFQNHADIRFKLNANPLISLGVDAVINNEGKLERINHWVNKMWKLGGSKQMKIDEKLKFLYENDRQEQVGMYIRNKNLEDKTFPESYILRRECERIHGHIKNTVKFDVRRIIDESRELYVKLNFITYQLLVLINLANNIEPANAFENFI